MIGEATQRLDKAPRPRIRLFSERVVVHSEDNDRFHEEEMPLVALSFDYGSRVIDADENLAFDFAQVRNAAAENGARRILENFGLVDLACLETIAVAPGVVAHYALACEGDVHRYCAFSAYVVPQLRTLGFDVAIDRDYPYNARAGDSWYFEVGEDEGDDGEEKKPRDWFNLELGVEIDGSRVNLLPTLLDLLNQHRGRLKAIENAGSRHIAVKSGEHGYVSVPRDRLKMLFEVLVELHRVSVRKSEDVFIPIDDESVLRLLGSLGERGRFDRGSHTDRAIAAATTPKAPPVPPPAGLRAELRPYQAEGLAWMQHLRSRGEGGILADEMGLGKTLQVISHLLAENDRAEFPSLVIAPTSLVSGWAREIAKFAPSLKVVVLHGHKRHHKRAEAVEADVVLTTYPLLVRDEEELVQGRYHVLVLDEAHTIKNPRSETHRAAQKLVAEQRIALSGTPLENHLGELFAIADFVAPGALGDELGFRRTYRAPGEDSNDDDRFGALRARLAPFLLRRTKDEVAKDLPPKTEIQRPVSLAGRQRDLYECIRLSAHAQVRQAINERGLAASTVSILDALLKLREVCCDPRLVRLTAARTVRESAKLAAFLELVAAERARGRRILVFSQFTRMIAILQSSLTERGIAPLVLTGQTRERQRVIDAFEKDRVADVFLLSLKAAGVGLTLTSAETVIHYDPWWNPAVQDQATDRAHRIGQKKPVFVHTLFVAGSVEERLLALQDRKRRLARAVLDGASDAAMSLEDVDYLFAPLGG